MQAPTTTEGGPAGRDPQAPICPACGATNTPAAAFCWQCYRAFGNGATAAWPSSPQGSASWPLAPAPPGPFAAAPHRSRIGTLAAVVAVTLGVVAVVAFVAMREDSVSFPEAFSGLARSTDGQSEAASASFRMASDVDGLEADMAFYDEGGMPVVALAWLRGAERTPGGADEAFDAFAEGVTSEYSGIVLTTERVERTVDGVEYICASVGGTVAAGLCLWQDEDVFWVLMDVRPGGSIGETKRLAIAAHDAVS